MKKLYLFILISALLVGCFSPTSDGVQCNLLTDRARKVKGMCEIFSPTTGEMQRFECDVTMCSESYRKFIKGERIEYKD